MPFIEANGIKTFYNDTGRGQPLVLLHGAGATGWMWSYQINDLLKAGYRIITYDVRGHGATSSSDGMYSIALFSQDLDRLLYAIGVKRKVFLCGLSMGGLIAQQYATDHPDKVKAIVLANTYSKLTLEQISAAVYASVDELKKNGILEEYLYNKQIEHKATNWNAAEAAQMAADILFTSEPYKSLFVSNFSYIKSEDEMMKIRAATGAFDSSDKLDLVKCPVQIIASENDVSTPVMYSEFLHKNIRGSKMHMIKNSNHISCMDSYKEFNRVVIDFLNSIRG